MLMLLFALYNHVIYIVTNFINNMSTIVIACIFKHLWQRMISNKKCAKVRVVLGFAYDHFVYTG